MKECARLTEYHLDILIGQVLEMLQLSYACSKYHFIWVQTVSQKQVQTLEKVPSPSSFVSTLLPLSLSKWENNCFKVTLVLAVLRTDLNFSAISTALRFLLSFIIFSILIPTDIFEKIRDTTIAKDHTNTANQDCRWGRWGYACG